MWRFGLRLLTFTTLLLVTTACFDIEEEINLQADGSGSYQIAVDMTKVMEMMSGFMTEEQLAESDMFGSMDSALQAQVVTLRAIEGLHNVRHMAEGYRFTLAYDFDDVEALNAGAASGAGMDNATGTVTSGASYNWTKKTFERENTPIEDVLNSQNEEEASAMEMAKMMLSDAKYTITYRFPGGVKKFTNPEAVTGEDGKSVILSANFLKILEGETELGNKVTFKRR